jgi:hypothetical protein
MVNRTSASMEGRNAMSSIAFAVDRRQIVARAWLAGVSFAVFSAATIYASTTPDLGSIFSRLHFSGLVGLGLVAGGAIFVHSGFGLLTDTGRLPRLFLRQRRGGTELVPIADALKGPGLRVDERTVVEVRSVATRREGRLDVGFKVKLTMSTGGGSRALTVVTGSPDDAHRALIERLRRQGLQVLSVD